MWQEEEEEEEGWEVGWEGGTGQERPCHGEARKISCWRQAGHPRRIQRST